MDLRQLEYFVAVAEERSFTRAAERTHVAQPGISAQIRRLERDLGLELFDRSNRTVSLTEAGAAALPFARAALRDAAAVRQAVDDVAGLLHGKLMIGTMTATRLPRLVGLLSEFHRAHPGIDVHMMVDSSDHLTAGVVDGSYDLVLAGVGRSLPSGVEGQVVAEEKVIALVPSDHELAGRATIKLDSLCRHDLVAMATGTGVRSAFDDAIAGSKVSPRVVMEAPTPDSVADLAAAGFGVGVAPVTMADLRPDLAAVEIVRPRVVSRIALLWSGIDPAATPVRRAFLDQVRSTVDRGR